MLTSSQVNSFYNKRKRKSFFVKHLTITYKLNGSRVIDTKVYKYQYINNTWYQIGQNENDKGKVVHWFGAYGSYPNFPWNYFKNSDNPKYDFSIGQAEINDDGDITVVIQDGNIKNEFPELDSYIEKMLNDGL